ncbi:MAG TPA: hypothetical protein VIM20_08505, partial [Candidatus Limnocylindrales bacterium]
ARAAPVEPAQVEPATVEPVMVAAAEPQAEAPIEVAIAAAPEADAGEEEVPAEAEVVAPGATVDADTTAGPEVVEPEAISQPPAEPEGEPEPEAEMQPEAAPEPEIEPEPEVVAEPVGLGIALGAAAEASLYAGDFAAAREGLLAAARAHRRAGRLVAAVDACYLAISVAPADPDVHLLLVEIYLDRGWRSQAADKLLLLGRLADLDADTAVRERLCQLVTARMSDEPRVAELCA